MALKELTIKLAGGGELSAEETRAACEVLLGGGQPLEEQADFLRALHAKGETPAEIAAFVEVLLGSAVGLTFSGAGCLDVCGTGGDRSGMFNVSTAVMFVAAGCGARVVKHGNRGMTSKSGGADVLEALGIPVDLGPERSADMLGEAGCCFLFAPVFHPAFAAVAPVRKHLALTGSASIFNMLGPLLNPARPEFQLAGVYEERLLESYVEVFEILGRRRAWAVHGTGPDGARFDEISPVGETRVSALEPGGRKKFVVRPEDFGFARPDISELLGGTAERNAGIIFGILTGGIRNGARTIVLLNAAAALVVAGVCDSVESGLAMAAEAIDRGTASTVLKKMQGFSS